MRVDSHTQIRQAMRALIHTHIPCRLLVEGNAPKPLLNTEFHSVAARSPNAFCACTRCPVSEHRGVVNRSPLFAMSLGSRGGKIPPRFFLSATVATVATVLGVPLKTSSRPLRASRFTRLLQTRLLPPPCKSAGYAVRRVWFCSRTSPDVLPASGWHSHSNAW